MKTKKTIRNIKSGAALMLTTAILATGCSAKPEVHESKTVQGTKLSVSVNAVNAEGKNQIYMDYLKHNKAAVDIHSDQTSKGLSLMDNDLENHRLFLTGEVHRSSFNTDVQISMLRYLNEKAGVRYYMSEYPFSVAQMINMYLNTGDEKYLPRITDDELRLWKWIHDFNGQQPVEKRISFVGMDVEHDPLNGLVYLNLLLEPLQSEGNNIPNGLRPFMKAIRAYAQPQNKQESDRLRKGGEHMLQLVDKELKQHLTLWEKTLDEETFFRFRMTGENLLNGAYLHTFYTTDYPRFNSEREPMMFNNFKELDKEISKKDRGAKYYGEWGLEHVYQKEHSTDGFKVTKPRIAELINEYGSFQGKVLSIGMMYAGSKCFDMVTNKAEDIDQTLQDMTIVGPLHEGDATLYKLNAANSPFASSVKFVDRDTGGGTLDYLQYILLILKSPASKPL
ncbi:erythromycin esterase family protein [Paenibacillus sediminis]|uniref:Erythromycin esterase n=1 Tax=Paenibacillus sediminis TaxID=664909 RepID=A0ABS4H2H7_9BACL|nr:erythromycin esterase family protein [Paenibacillus sediminis]MBP1936737.1 hypothetical protein [Paenibacillus sediminis]